MTISYPPSLTFLGDSRMQSREICVFPVYLLRGHVPCNRFSFLLHRPRIGASNSSASSFFLSFLFPLFTRIETRTTFSRSRGYMSSFTKNGWTGYGLWKRSAFDVSNDTRCEENKSLPAFAELFDRGSVENIGILKTCFDSKNDWFK